MRRLLITLLLMAVPIFAQDIKKYEGTWQASFQGKPFFTMNLAETNGKLTGTVVHDNVKLDDQGNLTGVAARDAHEKVTMIRANDNGLDIYVHDDTEPTASGHYRFEVTGQDEGTVKLVFIDPTGTKVKPWTVKKVE